MSSSERYLRLLGVPARAPSLAALDELVRAQLTRVPFENVSKLHRRRAGLRELPDLERHLDGVERHHFGGTCYPNNLHLHGLLAELGYDVRLCGADMTKPDVHLACIVTVDGHEHIVDGGYGAPFLAPLPRDLDRDHVIELGRERYVLRPQDAAGRSRLDLYRDGVLQHGYLLKPEPRRIEEFAAVIADSFRDDATFMNALVAVRFFPGPLGRAPQPHADRVGGHHRAHDAHRGPRAAARGDRAPLRDPARDRARGARGRRPEPDIWG